jgi:uncharacterized protein YjbI with pentapeptide repeats
MDSSLVDRWQTRQGSKLAADILQRLAGPWAGKTDKTPRPTRHPDLLRHLPLERVEGRADLRGFGAPAPHIDRVVRSGRWEVALADNLPTINNAVLKDVDLSYAKLVSLRVVGSRFENCLFEEVDLTDVHMWAVEFRNCSFRGAKMRGAVLGPVYEGHHSLYDRVDFSDADLRDSTSSTAMFRDCDFSGARLVKVNFGGSRFVRCRFAGELREVVFRAQDIHHADVEPNTMEDVDFSQASLPWTEFHGLNLDRVRFPEDGRHVVLQHWRCTLERALSETPAIDDLESRIFRALFERALKRAGPHQEVGCFSMQQLIEAVGETGAASEAEVLRRCEAACVSDGA